MAVEVKVAPDNRLELKSVFLEDRRVTSQYFNLTELPDTFTGGKNAFLIAGTDYLEPNTEVLVQIRDSTGRVVYTESSDGNPEYYEGISKVIAVYVYPTDSVAQAIDSTAFGPCTITILGELKYYDNDGSKTEVPEIWKGKYNIRYVGTANINPNLANTTRVRFFRRPQATITEILKPIYSTPSGSLPIASAITASYANIKLSRLETFAGDVKRVKVYRSSASTISDFELIQDIQIEAKELLQTLNASGSVVTDTGIFNSEVLLKFWESGSLTAATLNTSQFSSSSIAVKLEGAGNFKYKPYLDLSDVTVYELAFDAFYSGSSQTNLELHISGSQNGDLKVDTLDGLFPTKDFTNYVAQFTLPKSEPSASLYFKQTQSNWFIKDISLRASSETVFSPNEVSFVVSMPTNISNETFNFRFEFFDVNNNYVPVIVTGSQTFTGGNNFIASTKLLTFESDRTAFRFSTGSFGNPAFQQVGFSIGRTNLTGSVTYASAAFDTTGNYIVPASYAGTYPGLLTNAGNSGASLTIANFSGSVSSILVGSITYTASCEGFQEFETIYRFEDGENAPGVFVTANTNQFIYKATDLSLNPSGQTITIEAKRKNLASSSTPLTVNSGSGKPPLTYVSTNATNGVDTYTLAGSSYPFLTDETIYSISGSDQFGNQFSDAIKITPVKILDGFSVEVTNENASFPATSTGTIVGDLAASSGSITVKVGNETINYSSTFITNSFSASISSTFGLTANTFNGTNYSINALSADSGSLTLLVKYKDGGGTIISSSKQITYSKVKKSAPLLNFVIGNNNQTVTAKSTGEQVDVFLTASFTVNEVYNGVTTQKTFTPTSITATNNYIAGSSTATTLSLPNMADGTNSVDISITGSVVDSENTTRSVFGNISLSKTKKAVPSVVVTATPQAQSVLANKAGVQTGTLSNVTIAALEGSTNVFTSMVITSTAGFSSLPTVSGAILTMTSAVMNAAEGSVTLTVTHTDSEGTTGQTKTIIVRATKVPTGADGADGGDGTNGTNGVTGPGVVHTGLWESGRTYQFSDGLTDGTGRRDTVLWSSNGNAPYDTYYATTRQHLSATGNVANGSPNQAAQTGWLSLGTQDFFVAAKIGLFEDSYVQSTLNIGTTDNGGLSTANITLAGGTANPYFSLGQSPVGVYSANGIFIGRDSDDAYKMSLKGDSGSLLWDGTTLNVEGSVVITGGSTKTTIDSKVSAAEVTDNIGGVGKTVITGNKIESLNFIGKTATFSTGSIGGWVINANNIASPPVNGKHRLQLFASPSININNADGEGKLFIRSGPLTDYSVTSDPISLNFGSATLLEQIDTTSYNTFIYSTNGSTFSIPTAGSYNGTIQNIGGYSGVAYMNSSDWSGYLYVGLSYQIASDSSFNNIVAQNTITSRGISSVSENASGQNLNLPAVNGVIVTGTFAAGTYYTRLVWTVIANSDISSVTINPVASGTITHGIQLARTINLAEFTDEGLQLVRSNTNFFRVERNELQGANNAYVKIGGVLEVTSDIISLASDRRLKENIIPIDGALDKIDKINGVYFNYTDNARKANPGFGDERQVGLIAQEIQQVLPEVIRFAPFDYGVDNKSISGENYLTLNYDKVVPLLLQAIKELKCELDEVKKLIK
jgi:hypothetical protein